MTGRPPSDADPNHCPPEVKLYPLKTIGSWTHSEHSFWAFLICLFASFQRRFCALELVLLHPTPHLNSPPSSSTRILTNRHYTTRSVTHPGRLGHRDAENTVALAPAGVGEPGAVAAWWCSSRSQASSRGRGRPGNEAKSLYPHPLTADYCNDIHTHTLPVCLKVSC